MYSLHKMTAVRGKKYLEIMFHSHYYFKDWNFLLIEKHHETHDANVVFDTEQREKEKKT